MRLKISKQNKKLNFKTFYLKVKKQTPFAFKNILKVDRFRQFSKPYVGSTMLFSRTKPPRKVLSVSEDSFGYLVLRDVSFMSVAFIVWKWEEFL